MRFNKKRNIDRTIKYSFHSIYIDQLLLLQQQKMGLEASSEKSTQATYKQEYVQEDYELLDIQKINISDKVDVVHAWIDRQINSEQNIKHYNNLKGTINLQRFTSVRELKNKLLSHFGINQKIKLICAASLDDYEFKELQNDNRVISIALFCQNEQRAELLQNNFPKVIAAFLKPKEFYNSFKDKKYQTQIKVEILSILFFPSNTRMINKFRLNYNCMCCLGGPKLQAKQDFIKLCQHLFPNRKAEISKFSSQLKLEGNINSMILKWAFNQKSFFWEVISKLPKVTIDSKRLGYLRLPFYYLYKAILEQYTQQAKKSSPPSKLFIVSEVNENQQEQLINNKQSFLTFTTYVKGFTSQQAAIKKKRSMTNGYIFEIDISRAAIDKKLDFGYVIDQTNSQENVIFNLNNFFNIDKVVSEKKYVYVRYGSLAYLNLQRLQPSAQRKLTYQEQDLLRNYDYLEDLSSSIHSQANILEMSGQFQDAIKLYKDRTDDLIEKKVDTKCLDRHYLELAEAYKMNQQYRSTEKIINHIETQQYRLMGKIVMVQVLLKKDHIQKMNQKIQQLKPLLQQIKEKKLIQYFRLQNLIGVSKMKQNKIEQAKKYFQDLLAQIRNHYGFKYQGIPLVHDVMRNIAIIQHRLKNKQQAVKILQNVKRWQNACEGTGPSLALTQAILNSIHIQEGMSPKFLKSRKFLQSMNNKVTFNQIDYINANVVVIDMKSSVGLLKRAISQSGSSNINLNESSVNVGFINQVQKSKPNINLDQSSISVDFDKPNTQVNLDQSSVNVHFDKPNKSASLDQSSVNVHFDKPNKPTSLDQSSVNVNF